MRYQNILPDSPRALGHRIGRRLTHLFDILVYMALGFALGEFIRHAV